MDVIDEVYRKKQASSIGIHLKPRKSGYSQSRPSQVDSRAEDRLYAADRDCIRYVISEGDVAQCHNPGAVVMSRMRKCAARAVHMFRVSWMELEFFFFNEQLQDEHSRFFD